MKRMLSGLFAILFALPLHAGQGPNAVRKQAEASMLLTGTIAVGTQGEVGEYAIDQSDKVSRGVLDFVGRNIDEWRFKPMTADGRPASVRNRMSLRLVAKRRDDGSYTMRIGGVDFQPYRKEEGTEVTAQKMNPPSYPMGAARAQMTGTVYLIVKIGRDGSAQDVFAEQVNLRFVADEGMMKMARDIFSKNAIRAAKQWTFVPPTKGEQVDAGFWVVRVPVDYRMVGEHEPAYGAWEAYVPGPRQFAPWQDLPDLPNFSPDTMVADGSVHQVGGMGGLRLLTPLSDS